MTENRPSDLQELLQPVWEGDFVYEESFFALMPRGVTEDDALEIPLL